MCALFSSVSDCKCECAWVGFCVWVGECGLACLCGCMCQRSLVQETNYLRLMHKNEKLVFLFHLFPRVPGDIKNNTGRKGVTWRLTSENGNEAEKQVSGKNIGSGSLRQRPAFVTKTICLLRLCTRKGQLSRGITRVVGSTSALISPYLHFGITKV